MTIIKVAVPVEDLTIPERWCKAHSAPHRIVLRRYTIDDKGVLREPDVAACRVEVRRVDDDLREPD